MVTYVKNSDIEWFQKQGLSNAIIQRLLNPIDEPIGIETKTFFIIKPKPKEETPCPT